MVVVAILGTVGALLLLIACTDRVDRYYRNRKPRMGAIVETETITTPLWRRVWRGVCADCHTEDEPDMWLPHLCYTCAELARVRKQNGNTS